MTLIDAAIKTRDSAAAALAIGDTVQCAALLGVLGLQLEQLRDRGRAAA